MARLSLSVLCLLLAAACSQQEATTALPIPDVPPALLVSFSGTLQPQATDTYTFTVTQSGNVQATLLGLGAPPSTAVALAIGTASTTGVCETSYSVTTTAGPAAQIIGTGLAGNLCITIHDVGNLTAPAIYTITVAKS